MIPPVPELELVNAPCSVTAIDLHMSASRVTPFNLFPGYSRIRVVQSFHELVTTPFADGINALCWPRTLSGDFGEVVAQLGVGEGIVTLEDSQLRRLPVSAAGRTAIAVLLEDQRWLRERGLDPVLNCVHDYPRDDDASPVSTDVYSFHADRAPVETETWLCTYHGPPSAGLRNDEAQRRVDIPETRAELLRQFGGEDGDAFRAYLGQNSYDLHYAPAPRARPFSFGQGNLWRIAVDWPGSPVPPCIHRAPAAFPDQPPRLLLLC
ncbi:MAG: hypothetical protein ABI680_04805 [Chthoniobacteraceae bacterium]